MKRGPKGSSPTHCRADVNNKHHFEVVGIHLGSIIRQCTQCHMCVREKIILLGTMRRFGDDKEAMEDGN